MLKILLKNIEKTIENILWNIISVIVKYKYIPFIIFISSLITITISIIFLIKWLCVVGFCLFITILFYEFIISLLINFLIKTKTNKLKPGNIFFLKEINKTMDKLNFYSEKIFINNNEPIFVINNPKKDKGKIKILYKCKILSFHRNNLYADLTDF